MFKKIILLSVSFLIIFPLFAEAKVSKPKGYERARGSLITVSEPLGWPVSVSAKIGKLDGSIESLPGMAVIRVKAYKSWYNMFTTIPATTTLSIRGLPANKELHIYTNGYREHQVMVSTEGGALSLERPTGRGMEVIIKDRPSTKTIRNNSTGGDCNLIGNWTDTTKTCKLTQDVSDSIVIVDDSIILDGSKPTSGSFSVIGAGSGDGVRTDGANVIVKNLNIRNFARGVVYADSFFSVAPSGGTIDNVSLLNNSTQLVIDDIPGVFVRKVNITSGTTGMRIVDTRDILFSTDNITLTNSIISGAGTAIQFVGIEGVLLQNNTFDTNTIGLYGTIDGTVTAYRNNFKNNTNDISGLSGPITLNGNSTIRGNYWSKNTATTCNQSTTLPNHCDDPFDAGPANDALPWACENGWVNGVVCPSVPNPPEILIRPVEGYLACHFPSYPGHSGVDVIDANILNRNVYAAGSGEVIVADSISDSQAGKWVKIFHGNVTKIDGTTVDNISTRYLHLNDVSVTQGSNILQGSLIGAVGSTGSSTGPHLHFDIRQGPATSLTSIKLNPEDFITYPVESDTTLCLGGLSPINLRVIDPDGLVISNTLNQIGDSAQYWSLGSDEFGDLDSPNYKLVMIYDRKVGIYQIDIEAEPNANLNEDFTIVAKLANNTNQIELTHDYIYNLPISSLFINSIASGIQPATDPNHESNKPKVEICHRPPGNTDNSHTITVGEIAVSTHMAHGDTMGSCNTATASTTSTIRMPLGKLKKINR